jgi:protein subunit release factor A
MERTIEIRAAEGGDDAKIFASQLSQTYLKLAAIQGWKAECL